MFVLKSELIRPFDVDQTLVLEPTKNDPPDAKYVMVEDPLIDDDLRYIRRRIHEPMVRLLREEHQRGATVIVWSRSGWEWARNVLCALGIDYNQRLIVMSKPLVYFDDCDIGEWLKDRVWLDPNFPYKT